MHAFSGDNKQARFDNAFQLRIRADQLRPFEPPWKTAPDNKQILKRVRKTSRGMEVCPEDNLMLPANGKIKKVSRALYLCFSRLTD